MTPVSQFYFQQAYNNVVLGPWKRIAEGYGKMVLGYFGKTPVPPDPEDIVRLASEQLGLEPTTRDPREINDEDPSKGIEAAKKLLAEQQTSRSRTSRSSSRPRSRRRASPFSRASGPTASARSRPGRRRGEAAGTGATPIRVEIGGAPYDVEFDGRRATVNGRRRRVLDRGVRCGRGRRAGAAPTGKGEVVAAELAGQVLRLVAHEGDASTRATCLLMLEALKMEIEVKAPAPGTVGAILVSSRTRTWPSASALVELA